MDFIDLVKKRKSTRKYNSKKIEKKLLDKCLEAARLAPSACNSQPWRFIIIETGSVKDRIIREAFNGVYALNTFAKKAPVIVVVVREKSKYTARLGGSLRDVDYSLIDIGIACDHLTLQAEELGIGSCWIGWFNEKAIKNILELPKNAKVDIVLSLGYPEEDYIKAKKRKSLDDTREYFDK